MACRAVVPGTLTLAAVLIIGILSPATFAKSPRGFRASLTRAHRCYGSNHSAAARHDARRLASLSSAAGPASTSSLGLQTLVESGAGAFLINLSIGTPPLAFPAFLDTGSDLTWTQCAPCTACFDQPTPLYEPSGSSTFSKLPCASPPCRSLPAAFRACNATTGSCVYDYRYTVGFAAGYLAADTLALGGASFPGVAFGCSTANGGPMDGASGIAGLGRGALSLVSQLGVGRFSYCLRLDADAGASPILFGSMANDVTGDKVQFTPLVQNPVARHAPYYYVNLTGITVGATDLAVTFGFTSTGTGGLIVDSGTTFTYLADAGYMMVRQAFLSQTAGLTTVSGAPFDFDLCFATAGVADAGVRSVDALPFPRLVLRFASGAEYVVPRKSYFDAVDERGSVACLLVLPTRGVSVIGNVMQMDLLVLYDLEGGALSFAPADCASV